MPKVRYVVNEDNKLVATNLKPNFVAAFFDEIITMGLKQINHLVNDKNNTLDLVFVNDEYEFILSESISSLVKIDKPHPPVDFTIYNVIPKKLLEKTEKITKFKYNNCITISIKLTFQT